MIWSLQYLRALAAIMVVVFHAGELQGINGHSQSLPTYVLASGVDIFFVLSGFLMARLAEREVSAYWFFVRRILRVGPIYWLLTILLAAAAMLRPGLSTIELNYIVVLKSLFFVPANFGADTLRVTILPVGWSLVYEVYFYLIFALSIFAGFRVRGVLLALFGVFAIGLFFPGNWYLNFYSNPMVLEFALGVAIAKVPAPSCVIAKWGFCLSFALLLVGAWFDGRNLDWRLLSCGIAAAFVVYFVAAIDVVKVGFINFLGVASYSIYLVHMYGMKYVALPVGLNGLVSMSVIGVVFGVLVYWFVERNLNSLVGNWVRSPSNGAGVVLK